jgi:hypothetical protein
MTTNEIRKVDQCQYQEMAEEALTHPLDFARIYVEVY